MVSTLLIVLPVFALIFVGWLSRRIGALGPNATSELNRFVVYLALPALLFDVMAHAHFADIWRPGFIAAYSLGCLFVFALALGLSLRRSPHLADAAIDGLNASYANTGYMGFPLAALALGDAAMTPALIATIVTVCVLFALAIALIEAGLQSEKHPARLVASVVGAVVKNPLVAAPVLGACIPLSGLAIPPSVESFLKLLGGAASPCALVALGLFLAEKRETTRREPAKTAILVGFKLVLHPVLTWILAALVFRLPPLLAHSAVLFAALPTGTGPFMLAEFYDREADITAKAVLYSTIVSVLTISIYLALAMRA